MILNKIIASIKAKRIFDLKYIIVELALIFTGITLAASYNDYKNEVQDEKFIKETIIQIYHELKSNNFINTYYTKGQKETLKNIKTLKKYILEHDKKGLQSKEAMIYFSRLTNMLSLSNSNLGFTKLVNKDINLVKNEKVKNEIINYYDSMNYDLKDLDFYNRQILETKPFLIKHFINFNISEENYSSIKNIDSLINDNEFLNNLNFTINSLESYISTNEFGVIPSTNKMIKKLEENY